MSELSTKAARLIAVQYLQELVRPLAMNTPPSVLSCESFTKRGNDRV